MPEAYDVEGRKVFRPDARRHSGFKPTFPAGRFLSQPLKHWCSDFADLRRFLSTCRYVSDKEQFGKNDYWQPPEEFEESRKGEVEPGHRAQLFQGFDERAWVGRYHHREIGWVEVLFRSEEHTSELQSLRHL